MKKLLCLSLLVVSVGGIALCAAHIVPYVQEEMQSASLYAELAAIHTARNETDGEGMTTISGLSTLRALMTESGDDAENGPVDGETPENGEGNSQNESLEETSGPTSPPVIHSGLLKLHQRNPDCVAWISIEGTVIDYPVMYRPSQKNYYLHRDFNGKHVSAGALFIAENCDPESSDNVIIYGHHMNSGKMFAALNKYKKQSFYEKHRRIVYDTLNGTEFYEVIFAFTTPVYTGHDFQYYAFSKANSAEEYDDYISACRSRSRYDTGKTAQYGDKLLTLSTCEYSQRNGRMVVVAKRIS